MSRVKRGTRLAMAAMLLMAGTLACRTANVFVALRTEPATETPVPTRRPTFTPQPTPTNTSVPTPVPTKTAAPLPTATNKPVVRPTAKPPTPVPAPAPVVQPTAVPAPTVSTYEFHATQLGCSNPTLTTNIGSFLKGTVYTNRSTGELYVGAIVALGSTDGNSIYETVLTNDLGQYTFIISEPNTGRDGTWALWLVDPSKKRKSDIGGPIVTNTLARGDSNSCWASGVDFWK